MTLIAGIAPRSRLTRGTDGYRCTVAAKGRSWWSRAGFRIYAAAYLAVLVYGFFGDLNRGRVQPETISGRVLGIAGVVVVGLVAGVGLAGRAAVALRPSSAEVQYSLLSPVPRRRSLSRSIRASLTLSSIAAVVAMVALMLICTAQFSGLSLASAVAYLVAAAGVGVIGFGVHLLVAEGRGKPLAWAGVAVALTLASDIANGSARSPVAGAVRSLRGDAAVASIAAVYAVGGLLVWLGTRQAERIALEAIARGADVADRASVALSGNDLRTLLVLYRSLGARAWREAPLFRLPRAASLRWPVLTRSLRGIARWRATRWLFVAASAAGVGALLSVQPVSIRTTALAALVLWAFGLALNEPLAQEHDRADRLALLPNARSVEYRHIGVGWAVAFIWLTPSTVIALAGHATITTAIGVAAAAASGATVAAAVSFRATWKPLLNPQSLGLPPEAIASKIIYELARPGLAAFVCLAFWRLGVSGLAVAAPGVIAMGALLAWIATDGFNSTRRALPWLVSQ